MEEKTRVQKFIALSGLCSRRNAEDLIRAGVVKVNGEIVERDLVQKKTSFTKALIYKSTG